MYSMYNDLINKQNNKLRDPNTVVKSARNERVNKHSCKVGRQRTPHERQLAKLVKTGASNAVDVIRHRHFTVEHGPKVANIC